MKTIGLIGGITWYSTLDYYRILNELANKRLGGVHAAKLIINSVDFGEIKALTELQDWAGLTQVMSKAAKQLEAAGADCLMIGANTMHNIAGEVQLAVNIPLIHIADAVAAAIKKKHLKKVALLGTKYTMQLPFYKEILLKYGIMVDIPGEADITFINDCIYGEFGKGIFLPERKEQFLHIIDALISDGNEGIILGCTEIPILIKQEDCRLPVFDTAFIHSEAALEFALA